MSSVEPQVPPRCIAVVTTLPTREQALGMARALVERRLAACAQIDTIESIYRWQGTIEHEGEFRLLLKTLAARYDDVVQAIRERHSYELPAIHALALDPIEPAYAQWIARESSLEGAAGGRGGQPVSEQDGGSSAA